MVIEGEDYKIEFDEEHSLFDLYLVKVINAKDAEKRREELVSYGYGMPFDHVLRKIINYRLNKKHDVLDLKLYLSEFKEERKILTELTSTNERK